MTIQTDFRKMLTAKQKNVYQPATVTLTEPDSTAITETIQVTARGDFRRENCDMPGLMINFKTPTSPKLSGLKKMKLVCACGTSVYEQQLLLSEYLIYKMYNQLTEKSFRPRLAKLTYEDTRKKIKTYSQYAFFIEDVDDVAARNACKEVSYKPFLTEQTDRDQMTLVALFQYMIGNTDWSVPNFHNIKLIRSSADTLSKPFVVPYDFDFAGLVNAPYAIPSQELGIQHVTDRLYRGFPRTTDELQKVLDLLQQKKETFISMIGAFDLIDKKDRAIMIKYINDFYNAVSSKKRVEDIFINHARRE